MTIDWTKPVQVPIYRRDGSVRDFALVDEEDAERVGALRWHGSASRHTVYAVRAERGTDGKQHRLAMHRFVLGIGPSDMHVDHINQNGLDNRKSNIRVCEPWQNRARAIVFGKTRTGYRGVSPVHRGNGYRAQIKVRGVPIYLGLFPTAELAAAAYAGAAKVAFGEYAPDYVIAGTEGEGL